METNANIFAAAAGQPAFVGLARSYRSELAPSMRGGWAITPDVVHLPRRAREHPRQAFCPPPVVHPASAIAIRTLDIVVALIAIIFFAPVMLLVALMVFIGDPGPVIFAHRRMGEGGKHFHCFKFRTMGQDAEQRLQDLLNADPVARAEWNKDQKLRNDPRIIGAGHFMRKSSLDELPQLFNVLRGEMSLVGPRPIVEKEIVRYGRYYKNYCAVRPGITGVWQVSGRNGVSYRQRVAMDVYYSRNRTLAMHVRLMVLTVPCVLFARGAH